MNWATAEVDHSPRRKGRLALIAVAVLIAAAVLATMLVLRREAGRVERMLADIRGRGEAVTGAELDAFYARPKAEEDATNLWVRALAEVERTIELPRSGEYSKVPIQGNAESAGRRIPLPGAQWDDLALSQQYLREVAASMEALHAAADFGGRTRYPGSIADIAAPPLSRLMTLRDAARRLQLEACVRAHERDTAGTADSLHAALMLAQSMRDEPTTTSMLVRLAVHGMPVSLLLRFLPQVDFPAEALWALQRDLEAVDFKEQLWRAMCGERALKLSLFEQIGSVSPVSDPKTFVYGFTRRFDEATYIAMLNDWVALAKKPWPEMLSGEEPLVEKWESRQSPLHMLSNTASRGCGIGIDAMARSEALNRFATLAIALERVRRASGRPAERLQDLVPEFIPAVQDDPFTGEPFCYESDGSRYVLYSKARHDPIRAALKVADVLKVDPSRLLERAAKEAQVPPGSIWELPTNTYPYLLFRWPPLPEEPPATAADASHEPSG